MSAPENFEGAELPDVGMTETNDPQAWTKLQLRALWNEINGMKKAREQNDAFHQAYMNNAVAANAAQNASSNNQPVQIVNPPPPPPAPPSVAGVPFVSGEGQ